MVGNILVRSVCFVIFSIISIPLFGTVDAESENRDSNNAKIEYSLTNDGNKQNIELSEKITMQDCETKYQYHYFPSCNVYYDTKRELYFYLKREKWEAEETLPGSQKNKLGAYVCLELITDRPYIFNSEHSKKYSPRQISLPKKQKNVFSKIFFLLFTRR
jgi:hypothetical protein